MATGSSALKTHYPTQLTEVSQIPILSWEKIGEENQMPYEGMVGGTFDHSDLSYALKIKDDSMSPKFEVGDVLLVSENDKPEHGDYVIANILANSLKICRKYQNENESKLVALNPGYGVIHYNDTKFEIIAIVKESRMNLRV
ncbi:MAG TPA: S24 family peptidase [Gammaproteobacteria bacterium]|nr:S24 family peptidase [Gammaproteobacteria bacterium]